MLKLQDVDLNLLNVFHLMYKERKTNAVAQILGVSQPSVSNAISRLRKVLGNELFERTSHGMRPTPYADAIAEPISNALSILQDGINFQETFDPKTSNRHFRVTMTDLGEMYLLPKLMSYLESNAQNISISTTHSSSASMKDELESGYIDLAIGLLPQLQSGFYQRRLFDQKYVCLMSKLNPLASEELTLENFENANHIVIEASGTGHGEVESILKNSGVKRSVGLKLPFFMSAPYIVGDSNLIATVTEKLAIQTSQYLDLIYKPHPLDIPPAQINLFWHKRYHQDAGNIWLRNTLFHLFHE